MRIKRIIWIEQPLPRATRTRKRPHVVVRALLGFSAFCFVMGGLSALGETNVIAAFAAFAIAWLCVAGAMR